MGADYARTSFQRHDPETNQNWFYSDTWHPESFAFIVLWLWLCHILEHGTNMSQVQPKPSCKHVSLKGKHYLNRSHGGLVQATTREQNSHIKICERTREGGWSHSTLLPAHTTLEPSLSAALVTAPPDPVSEIFLHQEKNRSIVVQRWQIRER